MAGAQSERSFGVEMTDFKALICILSVAIIFIIIILYGFLFLIDRDGVAVFKVIGGQVQSPRDPERY